MIYKVIKGLSENKSDNSKIENEAKKEIIDPVFFSYIWELNNFMLCPFCREKIHLVDPDQLKMEQLSGEEGFAAVKEKRDLQLLNVFNSKSLQL